MTDRQLHFKSLDEALRELDGLTQAEPLQATAAWNWAQTLVHCAQSIEYSLTGFPRTKSRMFQRTLGTAAFTLFARGGRMKHDLGQPIPAAPLVEAGTDVAVALGRLKQAVLDFQQCKQALQPHFAYGELDKAAYERAHAMHLANHFSAFRQKT